MPQKPGRKDYFPACRLAGWATWNPGATEVLSKRWENKPLGDSGGWLPRLKSEVLGALSPTSTVPSRYYRLYSQAYPANSLAMPRGKGKIRQVT